MLAICFFPANKLLYIDDFLYEAYIIYYIWLQKYLLNRKFHVIFSSKKPPIIPIKTLKLWTYYIKIPFIKDLRNILNII